MATIKEILNQTLSECGFAQQPAFATAGTAEGNQLFALANREVNTLQKDTWQELVEVMQLPLTTATTYPLPAGYRMFVYDTAWAENNLHKASFPTSPENWSYLRANNLATGINYRVRIIGDEIEVYNPQSGGTLYAEYISDNSVLSSALIPKRRFTADDDTFLLNDDLLIMGVKWRFNKLKGMDWEADFAEWKKMYKSERATNTNAQTLSFAGAEYPGYNPPYADLWVGE